MPLYFIDATEDEIDPEFRQALFAYAETPEEAADIWDKYYDWGNARAQVCPVPHDFGRPTPSMAIDWNTITQTIVTL